MARAPTPRPGRTARRPSIPAASPPRRAARGRLRLREASLVDLPLLVRHRRGMWEDIGGRSRVELDRADGAYRTWVRRERRARRFVAFVVEDPSGRPAGSGAVWLSTSHPRPGRLSGPTMPYILSMYTEPEFRHRGVATRLVRAMVAWARGRRFARIFLHASTMGRPVYARLGFVPGNEMRLDLRGRRASRHGSGRARRRR